MLRNEDKRQKERAQREKERSGAAFTQEKNQAIFTTVQVSPTSGQGRQVSDILGDFPHFSKHHKPTDLIGVDHQPPTPAPALYDQIHEPDSYAPVRPVSEFGSSSSYSHRAHAHAHGPPPLRPPKPAALGFPHKTSAHQKFVEEVKPSLKSGPGPGPGPGPGRQRGAPAARDRRERAVRDPQLQKIMSEMSDIKSPVSAILQTPRPHDHHSNAFVFPAPAHAHGSPHHKEPPEFRLPKEPHLKSGG